MKIAEGIGVKGGAHSVRARCDKAKPRDREGLVESGSEVVRYAMSLIVCADASAEGT